MTWSYSGAPAEDNPKDVVRFLVQDTDQTDPLISDEEIAFLLSYEGGFISAAAKAAEIIGAKFARKADERVGDVSVKFSQKSKQYFDLAKKLKRDADIRLGIPFAGGISISEKDVQEADTDRVQPTFTKELHDYRSAEADTSENGSI